MAISRSIAGPTRRRNSVARISSASLSALLLASLLFAEPGVLVAFGSVCVELSTKPNLGSVLLSAVAITSVSAATLAVFFVHRLLKPTLPSATSWNILELSPSSLALCLLSKIASVPTVTI